MAKTRSIIQKRGGSKAHKRKGVVVSGKTVFAQGYNSSQMEQLLGLVALREKRALSAPSRGSSQLAAFGKLKSEHKCRSS
eukprot:2372954-Pleurochrysis_carterae.AAC.1